MSQLLSLSPEAQCSMLALFSFLTQIQDDRPRRHSDCRCAALPTQCPNLSKVKRPKYSQSKRLSGFKLAEHHNRRWHQPDNDESLIYATNVGDTEPATV